MAYYNDLDDEDESAQGMNGTAKPEEQAAPVSGGATSSSGTGGTSAPASPKATSSGNVGFQSYQNANKGGATSKLTSATNQNVAGQVNQAKTGVAQATNAFGQKADAGSLANRENAVTDVKGVVDAARASTAAPKPVAADGNSTAAPAAATAPVDPTAGLNTSRFQEVINAKYQGPESLRQAGLYQPAADKTTKAQNTLTNTGSAQGRENLLRDIYSQTGNYSQGQNKLDAGLLNSSQTGVAGLKDITKGAGNLQNQLDAAQIASSNLAGNRTSEIAGIRDNARNVFSEGKAAEEAATESRLSSVIENWDQLPEYFRNIIRNKEANNKTTLDQQVADYKTNNAVDTSNLSNIQAQRTALGNALNRDIEASVSYGGIPQQSLEEYQKQMAALDAQIAPITAKQAQYNQGLADLQNNFNMKQVQLSPEEAAMLGVGTGEGLYNLGADAIKTAAYDKNKLVSRDEQYRQAALAALGGLDQTGQLSTNLTYGNADAAGTQSALDALDVNGTRAGLNQAEQDFRDTAENTDLTGQGSKKVSRGNAFGKKTKTYNASVSGNAGDFLDQAGYDLDSELGSDANAAGISRQALLDSLVRSGSYTDQSANALKDDAKAQLSGAAQGGAAGAGLGSVIPGVGTGIGAAVGAGLGAVVGSGTIDPLQQNLDLINGVSPEVGSAIQKVRSKQGDLAGTVASNFTPLDSIGKALGLGSISSGIQGAVGGIDTQAMKAMGTQVAKQKAVEDLKRQYTNFLNNQGFDNRLAVADNETTNSRAATLEALLASLDKTNI